MYAQVVDDNLGKTLVAASSRNLDSSKAKELKKTAVAAQVGALVAERCKNAGILKVVFDRNGFLYHGRVKAVAEGARKGGLDF